MFEGRSSSYNTHPLTDFGLPYALCNRLFYWMPVEHRTYQDNKPERCKWQEFYSL